MIADHFGRNAEIGDNIVYANRWGSNLWLTDGVVKRVIYNGAGVPIKLKVDIGGEKIVTLTNPNFIILRKPWE
jgi:hypothetical protein